MLEALHIRNYILIDSLDVTFPEGLIIITGQTGAGKSILLGALSLLMGAKADASVISADAEHCVLEAEFSTSDDRVREILESDDIDWDGGHLTVRRVINATGRSRSFVNDCPVTVGVLSEISSCLADIHSQHQSLLLSDKSFQMSVLDHYAGNGPLVDDCASAWRKLLSLRNELSEVEERLTRLRLEKDYTQARFDRLEAAALRDGELDELEAEHDRLANAEEIKGALQFAQDMLDPQGDDLQSVSTALKEAQRSLEKVSRFVPGLESLSTRLEASRIEIDDILGEIADMDSHLDSSSSRLEDVEARMSLIYDLLTKYGCREVSELISLRDSLSEALFDSTALEERKEMLEDRISKAVQQHADICKALHSRRASASTGLAGSIQDSIRYLELDRAVFTVDVAASAPGPSGSDEIRFRFSANGTAPADLSKCASGGEMSRIMLCLKDLMARYANMPTLIFDEIDTGVSGSVADKMGTMICSMGKHMQVFAITHLPQVAAKGQAHFLVSKESSGRVTSTIKKLSPEERVLEIARMLSGSTISPEAVANARRLIGQSASVTE